MVCRLGSGQPTVGQTWVLLRSQRRSSGARRCREESIRRRHRHALIMGELQQGVVMVGLSVYWQQVVVGSCSSSHHSRPGEDAPRGVA